MPGLLEHHGLPYQYESRLDDHLLYESPVSITKTVICANSCCSVGHLVGSEKPSWTQRTMMLSNELAQIWCKMCHIRDAVLPMARRGPIRESEKRPE